MYMLTKVDNVENKRNTFCINALLWTLFIPLLNEFIVPATKYFIGESIGGIISVYIYGSFFVYACYKSLRYGLLTRGMPIIIYLQILAIFEMSRMMHPDRYIYYTGTEMQLLKMFFLPISIFLVCSIRDWSDFERNASKFAKWACVISCLKLMIDGLETTNYMNFSYAFLPFVGFSIYSAVNKKGAVFEWIVVCMDIIIMLMFGARTPVFFSVILILGLILLNDSSSKKIILIFICAIIATAIYYNLDAITKSMSNIRAFENSYFLENLQRGTLFKSDSREQIYDICSAYISTMGLKVNGLFFDRILLGRIDIAYPHNIVYEIMLQFGWLLGPIILFVLGFSIIKTFLNVDRTSKKLLFVFFMTLMGRFWVSGSYVTEFRFYVFMCIVYAMSKTYSKRRKNNVKC